MSSAADHTAGDDDVASGAPIAADVDFENVLRQIPDTIVRYDCAGRITFVNAQFIERTGQQADDVIGRRPFEWAEGEQNLVPDVEEYRRILDEVLETGEPRHLERVRPTPSGEPEVFQVLFRADRSLDGTITGAFAIARDVTDLVRTRRALDARDQQFHTLAENLPEVLMRFDTDGRVVYTNRQYDEQVGGPPVTGRTVEELDPLGADATGFRDAVRRALTAGMPSRLRLSTLARDGVERTYSVAVQPEFDSEGSVSGAIAIGHDVTELEQARLAIAISEHRFRTLAEHLPDIVVRYDADCRMTYLNRSLGSPGAPSEPLLGLTPTQLAGRSGGRLDEYERQVRHVLATGEDTSIVVSFSPADGDDRLYSVLIGAEHSDSGEVVGAISISRDVTDLVRAEQAAEARALEFLSLAENLPDPVLRYDLDARITYVSGAFDVQGQRPISDMIGRTATESAPGSMAPMEEYEARLRKVIATGEPASIDITLTDSGGRERVHSVLFRAERSPNGEIVGAIAIGRDITEVVRQREALEEAARTDALTGVASRKVLYDALPEVLAQRSVAGRPVAVLLLDLDGFKTINDQYGHRLGDEMLRQIAGRLATCVGEADLLVRVGGDEFVLVLGDVDGPMDASVLAHQARMLLADLDSEGPVRFPAIDASVGIAMFPDDGGDVDALLAHADLALYEAKRAGRGRVNFFHTELRAAMERRSAIEQALQVCVPDTEMSIHLQPICTLDDDPHVWGAEALLRWHHPELGEVPPDEFIPIAEQSGQIVPIGRWVMRRAAEAAVGLNRTRSRPLRVSVNVSTRQFTLDDIGEATRSALDTAGCDPRWLILEITESLLLEDLPLVHRALDALRSLGVAVAVDDFGTGYSSLHYLTRLRIDHMKVDKSFVRDADVDHQQQEIVRALVVMAHALGIELVAEGIESPGEAGLLERLGCRLGQGYLLARPMPIDQFTTWLTTAPTTLREALPA